MLKAEQILQGRYQLKQKLGRSISRQTWSAVDLETPANDLVVVKFLAFSDVQWDELKLFEREAQVLKHLNYPRIPKYRDYFCVEERSPWFGLVQEYIPGCSLKELLHQGEKFTEAQVRQIAADVLNILVYLHELSPAVLHRDIKPSNLIWGKDEQVYLVDFGAVQAHAAVEGVTFTVVGTYGYTPMEQFGGRAVPASDLYALGATIIHLLTGTAPADLPQKDLQIQFADWVNPNMLTWLSRLSQPAVERRYSSARQALMALEGWGDGEMGNSGSPLGIRGKWGDGEMGGFNDFVIPQLKTQNSKLKTQPPCSSINNSGQGGLFKTSAPVPAEIKGWNWGAFLAAPLWSLTNRVGIGLLAWVPMIGFWMAIALGVKGNEWAWKSREWQSIDHFKAHQRSWAIAGIVLGITVNLIFWHVGVLLLLSILI